ncbi:hypothetical protein [Foetidibacter luteolus]|uniref:hypothetical protein n=1 Tax=Foetidibacter luteolus TaxID=2608880 RepID=UPI00129B40AA|nr:hypothetical protein [Foetidibacter luteolus]
MKLLTLTLFISALFTDATGQKIADSSKRSIYKDYQKCKYVSKYTPAQRSRFYPFSIGDSVKLVSFRYHRNNCPVQEGKIFEDSLIEQKVLNTTELEKLTDILYNNFYYRQPQCCVSSITQCFFPRNAILFLDRTDQLKESILICFHCNRIEKSSEAMILGDNCNGKMEKLRQFFISSGIEFGTNTTIDIYPGETGSDYKN